MDNQQRRYEVRIDAALRKSRAHVLLDRQQLADELHAIAAARAQLGETAYAGA